MDRIWNQPPLEWIGEAGANRNRAFDFSRAVAELIADIVANCTSLRHIDPRRILVGAVESRTSVRAGLQARTTPLRFRDGAIATFKQEKTYRAQRYIIGGREFLYLIEFSLPRFLDQPFEQKLITVFHELFHISPHCNGDLRRFSGRNAKHGESKAAYESQIREWVSEYLRQSASALPTHFLHSTFRQLAAVHGGMIGIRVPRPCAIRADSD